MRRLYTHYLYARAFGMPPWRALRFAAWRWILR